MTVKVGVIGVGLAGTTHVNTLAKSVADAEVVAISDIAADRAQAVAADLPGTVATYTDAHELISDGNVEAVVVTSIAPTHADLVLACIAAGKPVFCEKPLAVTADECQQIVDAEIAAGRHLVQVGFMRRFDPAYKDVKAVVDEGTVGEVVAIHAAHRNVSVNPDFTSEMHTTEALIHEIDTHRWLLDDEYVDVMVDGTKTDGELLDPQYVRMRTAKGRHIDVELHMNAAYGYDILCEVVGRAGTVSLPRPKSSRVNLNGTESVAHDADFRPRFADAYRDELEAWIGGVQQDTVAGPTAWDGLVAAVVSDATIEALHSGVVETIDLPAKPDFY